MRPIIPLALVVLGFLSSSCKGAPATEVPVEAAAPAADEVDKGPLPEEPERLALTVWASSPDATMSKLQKSVGGTFSLLAPSFSQVFCSVFGIDARVSPELDGKSPVVGALSDDGYAFAVRLVRVPPVERIVLPPGGEVKVLGGLRWGASTASRDGGSDDAGEGIDAAADSVRMLAAGSPHLLGLARAREGNVTSDYLVVASSEEAMQRLAPYVYRTMPTRKVPAEPLFATLSGGAMRTMVVRALSQRWAAAKDYLLKEDERLRAEHKGREPDFGDPREIVGLLDGAIQSRLALLSEAESVELSARVEEDIAVSATLQPRPGTALSKYVEGMQLRDLDWLGRAPLDALASLVVYESGEERVREAATLPQAMERVLGKRVSKDAWKRLFELSQTWAKSRDDALLLSVFPAPRALRWETAVDDPAAAKQTLASWLAEVGKPGLRDPLLSLGRATTARRRPFEPRPNVVGEMLSLERAAKAKIVERVKRHAGIGYALVSEAGTAKPRAAMVLAEDVDQALSGAVGDAKLLRSLPRFERALRMRPKGTLGIVAQPFRLDPARASLEPLPVLAVLDKERASLRVTVVFPPELVRELTKPKGL